MKILGLEITTAAAYRQHLAAAQARGQQEGINVAEFNAAAHAQRVWRHQETKLVFRITELEVELARANYRLGAYAEAIKNRPALVVRPRLCPDPEDPGLCTVGVEIEVVQP